MTDKSQTHFGFQQVPWAEKAERVKGVFDSVAGRYDLMNDAMSLGLHRLWKHRFVKQCQVAWGEQALDLAAGTGDISLLLSKRVGPRGKVMMTDINEAMLAEGKARMQNAGRIHNVDFQQADAEQLPFADNTFDQVTMAFGLRNVTDQAQALSEMHRVLKPGGQAAILEFSTVSESLQKPYDWYSFNVLPWLGQQLAGDRESYQYLAESIRKHPDQATLLTMLKQAGFSSAHYENLQAGVVAMHFGQAT